MADETPQELNLSMERRYAEIGRAAIVKQHPHLRSFMASRTFDDAGFVRALLTEYIKHAASMDAKASDAEL